MHVLKTLKQKAFNVYISILASDPQCCLFYTVRPSWSSGKTLAANAKGRGFKPHQGQIFSHFTLI